MNKFAIDGHSGVLRIKPGETLDYEACRSHDIKVLAKVSRLRTFLRGILSKIMKNKFYNKVE